MCVRVHAGRHRWIPLEGVRAMGMYVTTLALPALLLRNMITLEWSGVDWNFFYAIGCAHTRRTHIAKAVHTANNNRQLMRACLFIGLSVLLAGAAKLLVFVCSAVLQLVRHGCASKLAWSNAGLYGIFITQSNDFAMGLPILTALFSKDPATANYPMLLYVLAPISLAANRLQKS
jgi:hypothetical protein